MSDSKQDKPKDWEAIAEQVGDEETVSAEPMEEDAEDEGGEGDEEKIPPTTLEHPSYQALEEQLTAAEQKAHENWDKALRARSELENVQRRAQRDMEKAHKYALENFVKELLPVLDSLDQALQARGEESSSNNKVLRDGVELTLKQFFTVFEKFSVQVIDPLGELFDPHTQEAMTMQEDPSVAPNTVLAVIQKGYRLHERILRPARVVVSKGQAKNIDEKA